MTLPLAPGAYLARRRAAAGYTTADVAARVASEPRLSELDRQAWIEAIEAGTLSPTIHELTALRRVFPYSVDVLAQLAAIADGEPLPPPHLCRECACSDLDACVDEFGHGCSWIAAELCSTCAPLAATAAAPAPAQAGDARAA